MKKFLVLSSLAAALLVTGCSQKGSVDSSANVSQEQEQGNTGYVSAQDNFVNENNSNIEDRISAIESNLQNVFFDFDKFIVRADMQSVVDNDASILTSLEMESLMVRIEGNTDEWGTDEYNYALGLKRAVAVKDSLVARGVSEARTILVSYGESKPTCTERTRQCWAENRKVTFKILP